MFTTKLSTTLSIVPGFELIVYNDTHSEALRFASLLIFHLQKFGFGVNRVDNCVYVFSRIRWKKTGKSNRLEMHREQNVRSANNCSMLYWSYSLENEVKYFKYNINWGNFNVVCYKKEKFLLEKLWEWNVENVHWNEFSRRQLKCSS